MITFDEVLKLLKQGKSVEIKVHLTGGIFSRHSLTLEVPKGIIVDHSFVDESKFRSTVTRYRKGFYGKAFDKGCVELEEGD